MSVTEDVFCNPFGFRIVWDVLSYWVNFEVYEIVARTYPHENPMFHKRDAPDSETHTHDHADATVYMSGHIKFDGCSSVSQKETHFCGASDYRNHISLMEYMYKRAYVLMDGGHSYESWIEYDQSIVEEEILGLMIGKKKPPE